LVAMRHVSNLPTLIYRDGGTTTAATTTTATTVTTTATGAKTMDINWSQLQVMQDTLQQYESPSLGLLGSTLQKTIPTQFDSVFAPDGDNNALPNTMPDSDPFLKSRRRSFSDTIISPILSPANGPGTVLTPLSLANKSGNNGMGGIHLGDFSLFTLSSPTILLQQSKLVESPLFAPETRTPPSGHHTSYIYVTDPTLVDKDLPKNKYVRQKQPLPPICFENIRRFAGVGRLDGGKTTR
jgi:hypothetical protein